MNTSSTEGGSVAVPGEGSFVYEKNVEVTIEAIPENNYEFGYWTGDVEDINSASIIITMDKHKSITANFFQTGSIKTIHVTVSGIGNGTSWEDTMSLQNALSIAQEGDEIWVAEGTYTPTDTTDRSISFQLKNGVAIYGGFIGINETSIDQRDWQNNLTILSGNINQIDSENDNSYHVFYHPETLLLDETAVLNGFIIADGYAGSTGNITKGAGMFN